MTFYPTVSKKAAFIITLLISLSFVISGCTSNIPSEPIEEKESETSSIVSSTISSSVDETSKESPESIEENENVTISLPLNLPLVQDMVSDLSSEDFNVEDSLFKEFQITDSSLDLIMDSDAHKIFVDKIESSLASSEYRDAINTKLGVSFSSIKSDSTKTKFTLEFDSNNYARSSAIDVFLDGGYFLACLNAKQPPITDIEIVDSSSKKIIDSFQYPSSNEIPVSGDIGLYGITIGSARVSKNYDEKECLVVSVKFTNNSTEGIAYDVAILDKAFQNGVQLDMGFVDGSLSGNSLKEIKPGATIELECVYVLSDSSPVDVEFEELLSLEDSGTVKKTFELDSMS